MKAVISLRHRVDQKRDAVLRAAKSAAISYYQLTGKPLGITGEIGEVAAAQALRLELAPPRTPGYDATDRKGRRLQIKTRCIPSNRSLGGQRIGTIKLNHAWDAVVLVLMDERFELRGIYEASRSTVRTLLTKTKSKARQRGALAVSEFIHAGRQIV
jgi:hypothetical protein